MCTHLTGKSNRQPAPGTNPSFIAIGPLKHSLG
jgi:hypothetical protein